MKPYKTAVAGQGYVSLPLVLEFAKYYPVFGFDIDIERVDQLNKGIDIALEGNLDKLLLINELNNYSIFQGLCGYKATYDASYISDCNIYIVTILIENEKYDSIILAVSHKEFLKIDLQKLKKENTVIFGTKGCLGRNLVDGRL